jgi:hypothetical protein
LSSLERSREPHCKLVTIAAKIDDMPVRGQSFGERGNVAQKSFHRQCSTTADGNNRV